MARAPIGPAALSSLPVIEGLKRDMVDGFIVPSSAYQPSEGLGCCEARNPDYVSNRAKERHRSDFTA